MLGIISTFTGRWVVGKLESNAKLNLKSDSVEVSVELGNLDAT